MAISDSFDAIRFYTILDPYYYTVDNRPLLDLQTNQNKLASSVDAGYSASKAAAIATGFVMRGYSRENYAVGSISFPSDMTFIVDRAVMNQALPASLTDSRDVPHIGIQVDPEIIGPFTAADVPGEERVFLVQARKVDASSSTPYYDAGNAFSPDAYIVGDIEYSIKQGADVTIGAGSISIPGPDAGWVPLFGVIVEFGSNTIDQGDLIFGETFARFFEEGAAFGSGVGGPSYQLGIDTRIVATPTQQRFTALSVDANYAMVFVDGVFQSGITVVNSTTIDLPAPVPAGTVVDFVTTAGGSYTPGTLRRDVRIATEGQTTFTNILVNPEFASVYIQGVYQDQFVIGGSPGSRTITLPGPLPAGTRVVFEEKSSGIANSNRVNPTGGLTGEVLTKLSDNDFDYDWAPAAGGGTPLPPGGSTGQVLAKDSPADGDAIWVDPPTGGISGDPFSVETQIASNNQQTFIVSSDPSTMLVFRDGSHITGDVTVILPNQVVLNSPVPGGTTMTFVQTGGGTLDGVTIQKENDLQLILNSREAYIPPSASINDIELLGPDTLIAGSTTSSELWISEDAGQTWESSNPDNLPAGIYGISFDGTTAVAVGEGGAISYSNDLGNSWTSITPISGVTTLHSSTYDVDNGYFIAVGDGGTIAHSADGISWSEQVVDSGGVTFRDVFSDSGLTVAVGTGGTTSDIYYSNDGTTWTAASMAGLSGGYTKVYKGGTLWVIGGQTEILTSLTGTSYGVSQAVANTVTGIFYIDGIHLVFTENGFVWTSLNSASTWIRYRMGGKVKTDFIRSAVASGNNISMLGSFQTSRYLSKIVRGF